MNRSFAAVLMALPVVFAPVRTPGSAEFHTDRLSSGSCHPSSRQIYADAAEP